MKKLLTFVILAIAGIATASADKYVTFQCPDGSIHTDVYKEPQIPENDQPEEDQEESFDDFCARKMLEYCGPQRVD